MNDLFLCDSCKRHVEPSEPRCPFCQSGLSAPPVVPLINASGLSRSKLYALHAAAFATSVAVAVACGGDTTTGGGSDAAAGDAKGDSNHVNSDSSTTDGDIVFNDAGVDVNDPPDTSPYDHWTPPPYGCVFPGACGDTIV